MRTKGFGPARILRDDLAGQVAYGTLPGRPLPEPPATAAEAAPAT